MSPALISTIGPPSHCVQPLPDVTISVCPSGCVCQALRAPGSNVTNAPATRDSPLRWNGMSMRTLPVKYSADPLTEGSEPLRSMCMSVSDGLLRREIAVAIAGGHAAIHEEVAAR